MLPDTPPPPDVSPTGAPADQMGRPLRSLRVSVTDRCNLRCNYCMPQEEYVWLPRQELLTFEEIVRLVAVFTSLGVEDGLPFFLLRLGQGQAKALALGETKGQFLGEERAHFGAERLFCRCEAQVHELS